MAQGYSGRSPYQALQGTGAPVVTPQFVGQQYIDIVTGNIYMAVGTSGIYNWGFIGKGGTSAFTKDTVAGLIGWFDCSDTTTITKDGSDIVSQINDKSDGAHNLTTKVSSPKYFSNIQNGLGAINFDGASSIRSGTFPDITPAMTVFIVVKPMTVGAGGEQNFYGHGKSGTVEVKTGKTSGTTTCFTYSGALLTGSNLSATRTDLWTSKHNGASSSIQLNNYAATTGNAGTPTSNIFCMGANNAGTGNFFIGYVCEMLIYSNAVSDANQEIVRTYLNNKWAVY